MDVKVFRMLMKGIVTGAITGTFLLGVPSSQNGSTSSPTQTIYNGCYPIGYWCGTRQQNESFTVDVKSPLTLEQCKTLCAQELDKKHGTVGTSINGNTTETGYVANSVKKCGSSVVDADKSKIDCEYTLQKVCQAAGRRPAGLEENTNVGTVDHVGQYFAHMAYLEEAAVSAFQHLVRELEAYNAPTHLIEMAREGVQEEVEHAEMCKALSQRYGATPYEVTVEPFQLRPLFEIAIDNITEGCVRETYGALAATYQSEHAEDPAVREVTRRIVFEESRHAMMSWHIAEWLSPQLSSDERDQCRQAMQQTVAELEEVLSHEPPPTLARIAGLPSVNEAQRMFQTLKQTLWA